MSTKSSNNKNRISGKKLNRLYNEKLFDDKLNDEEDDYEGITDLERDIMSYLDEIDILMVKPEERKRLYF